METETTDLSETLSDTEGTSSLTEIVSETTDLSEDLSKTEETPSLTKIASETVEHSEALSCTEPTEDLVETSTEILPDQTTVIATSTGEGAQISNKKRANVAVIAGTVAAVAAVVIVVVSALVCYLKRVACFGNNGDKSGSELEANGAAFNMEAEKNVEGSFYKDSSFEDDVDPFSDFMAE